MIRLRGSAGAAAVAVGLAWSRRRIGGEIGAVSELNRVRLGPAGAGGGTARLDEAGEEDAVRSTESVKLVECGEHRSTSDKKICAD